MASVHSTLGSLRLVAFFLGLGLLATMSTPVMGQASQSHRQIHPEDQNRSPTRPSQLPDWAEPANPSESNYESVSPLDDGVQTNQPGLPGDDPDQVPVDGGVFFLAAAGAGYAVRKLNRTEDEDGPA
jgi:hypothetical protein